MQWGIGLPQIFLEQTPDRSFVKDFVLEAEAMGYTSFWTVDLPPRRFAWLEPVDLLTYAGACTKSADIGTAILITTTRNPIHLAKALATLATLTHGHFILGAGVGGAGMEYAAYGMTGDRLVLRFLEGIRVMRELWGKASVTYEGTFVTARALTVEPKPGLLPVWFGASHPNALRRAALHGDGWVCAGGATHTQFAKSLEVLRRELSLAGKDVAAFPVAKRIYIDVDDDRAQAHRRLAAWFQEVYYTPSNIVASIYGSEDQCADALRPYVELAPDLLILNPISNQINQAERIMRVIQQVSVR